MDYLSRGLSLYVGRKRRNYFNNMGIRVLWQKRKKSWVCGTDSWYVRLLFFCWSVFYVCQKCQSMRWQISVYVHKL